MKITKTFLEQYINLVKLQGVSPTQQKIATSLRLQGFKFSNQEYRELYRNIVPTTRTQSLESYLTSVIKKKANKGKTITKKELTALAKKYPKQKNISKTKTVEKLFKDVKEKKFVKASFDIPFLGYIRADKQFNVVLPSQLKIYHYIYKIEYLTNLINFETDENVLVSKTETLTYTTDKKIEYLDNAKKNEKMLRTEFVENAIDEELDRIHKSDALNFSEILNFTWEGYYKRPSTLKEINEVV